MNCALRKLIGSISSETSRNLIAILFALQLIIVALLAVPMFSDAALSFATSMGQMAWDQLSTPSPPAPAGDLTIRVLKMWSNHFVEVELPRIRDVMARIASATGDVAV